MRIHPAARADDDADAGTDADAAYRHRLAISTLHVEASGRHARGSPDAVPGLVAAIPGRVAAGDDPAWGLRSAILNGIPDAAAAWIAAGAVPTTMHVETAMHAAVAMPAVFAAAGRVAWPERAAMGRALRARAPRDRQGAPTGSDDQRSPEVRDGILMAAAAHVPAGPAVDLLHVLVHDAAGTTAAGRTSAARAARLVATRHPDAIAAIVDRETLAGFVDLTTSDP